MIHIQMNWRSVVLQMDTNVDLLLPENRRKTEDLHGKKYPVLYILHGFKEDNASWLKLSNLFLLARDLDLIIVMPTTYYGAYVDNHYGLDYYRYITEELPIKLRNYFPISSRREDTFIMGESMGGYGTLHCALGHPELYSKAVCLSSGPFDYQARVLPEYYQDEAGLLDPSKQDPIGRSYKSYLGIYGTPEEYDASDNNIYNLVEKLKKTPFLPEIIFYCGTEDANYPNSMKFENHLRRSLPTMCVKSEYWHGEHNFFFWNQAIPKALREFGFEVVQNSVI